MKRYAISLLFRLIPLVITFLLIGYFLAIHEYYAACVAFVAGLWFTGAMIGFLKRTIKDTKRLIEAIHFSELNISFRNFADKGLFPELIPMMEEAILLFNAKLQQKEVEHQFYDTLINRIDSALLVISKTHTIEWINKAALDEFGKPQPHCIADFASIVLDLPEILTKIVPGEVKMVNIKKEGHIRHFAVTAVIFSSRGSELKLVSFKNIQPVLEESESDAWKKLIRVLTHEIMNSITPIISLSETLAESYSKTENDFELMIRAMQTIHRRSKGLVEFVDNYRTLMRIPAPVMNAFYAGEMMNEINNLLRADGIRFLYEIHPEDITLFADCALMEQTLINLIKNAWEACLPETSPDVKVHITQNEYLRPVIVISDNGCGIQPDVLDKIFVPFFTTKTGGSGIGLSICRQIMISHGGNISVESKPDKGTKVTLVFNH